MFFVYFVLKIWRWIAERITSHILPWHSQSTPVIILWSWTSSKMHQLLLRDCCVQVLQTIARHCIASTAHGLSWSNLSDELETSCNLFFSGPPTMSFQLLRHFKRFSLADPACHVLKEGWDMASHILLRKRRQQNAWGCDWRGFRNSEGQFFPRQSCSPGSFTVALRVTTALHEDSAFLLSKQQTIHLQNPPGPLCQTMPSVHVRRVSECMQTKDPLSEPRL